MKDGFTPLALAAEVCAISVLYAVHSPPLTLLSGVLEGGHVEVAKVLLNSGADAAEHISKGYTPLAVAAEVTAMQ